jgi:hypothetical protein
MHCKFKDAVGVLFSIYLYLKSNFMSQVWWCMPDIPASWKTEGGGVTLSQIQIQIQKKSCSGRVLPQQVQGLYFSTAK